ncbi:MAG: TolB family protein [Lachnospiraceae bacterium]|nr:TolB family protein [Lachnospiraceae bacterium]
MATEMDKSNPWYRDEDQSFLEIYDTVTGERELVQFFDYLIEAPNWTPDGKALVYNSNGRIFKIELETKEIAEVDTDFVDDCNNDHVLSPDGSMIAVSHATKEDGKSRIYTVPMTGGVPRLITPLAPSYLHGWSPDGKELAYCAERNGEYDIYTIPAEGGLEKRLTDAPGLNDGSEYDSAGEYIWFNSVRAGLMQAFRMKADGSEQTQMTFDEEWNTWFPHISPDRTKVVMVAYKKGDVAPGEHVPHKDVELRLMNADGSDLKTIVKLFGGQGTINVNSWSPDSRKFAFVTYQIRGEEKKSPYGI